MGNMGVFWHWRNRRHHVRNVTHYTPFCKTLQILEGAYVETCNVMKTCIAGTQIQDACAMKISFSFPLLRAARPGHP